MRLLVKIKIAFGCIFLFATCSQETLSDDAYIIESSQFDMFEYQATWEDFRDSTFHFDTLNYYEFKLTVQNITMTYAVDSVKVQGKNWKPHRFQHGNELLDSLRANEYEQLVLLRGDSIYYLTNIKENLRNGLSRFDRPVPWAKYSHAKKYFDYSFDLEKLRYAEKFVRPFPVYSKDTSKCLEILEIEGKNYMEGYGVVSEKYILELKKVNGIPFNNLIENTCERFGLTKENIKDD